MKPHTSDFKNAIKEMGRELRGVITYGNTTLEEEIMSITPHYEANILKSVMKQLDLELSVDIPLETVINCQIGILVNGNYEMLNFGNYVVYSSEKQEDTNTYRIVCYDKILYAMKQNEDLGVTYPITIKNYLIALANKIGLTVASGTFYNQDLQIPSELYVGLEYTYRDILDEIAQATGSIITLNNNDEIEVRYPNDLGSQTTVSGTNITISEHAGNKIVGTIIDGNTTQDSTTGKNLFNMDGNPSVDLLSGAGYTLKYNDDKTITINGTGTGAYKYLTWNLTLEAGTYIASGCPSGGSQNGYSFLINVGSSSYWDYGNGVSFTLTAKTTIQVHPIRYGSNIPTFNNVTFKPMIRLSSITDASYEPYTGGIASPNPQYEQPINSAGDNINLLENTYTTSGTQNGITHAKNADGTMLLNGTATATVFMILNTFNLVAGTYILSGCPNGGSENGYRQDILVGNNVITKDFGSGGSFTLNEDTSIQVRIRIGSGTAINNLTFKPMIAKGSIATPYSPYGMGSINEVIQNKNSLDIPNNTVTASGLTATIENGIVSLGGTSTSTSFLFLIRNKLSLKAGTYTISAFNDNASSDDTTDLRVTYRNGDGIIARAYLNNTNVSLTFTLDTDLEEGCLQIRSGSGNTFNNFVIKPQLELGSSATSFVPHQEQNISIPCQQPMRSIGDIRDVFVKQDGVWYEKHNIGQVVLNGGESWGFGASGVQNTNGANVYISSMLKSNFGQGLCNYFIRGTSKTANALRFGANDSQLWFYVKSTDFANVNDWKTWLSTHNTEVIYQLAEAIYLECTEEQITALENIAHTSLYSGDTHISSEGYLSITYFSTFETIDEEYLKDVNVDFRSEIWSYKFHCFK